MAICFLLAASFAAVAEFYRYVDENGGVHFVDDKSKIPEKYLNQFHSYQERTDAMLPHEREAYLRKQAEKERRRQESLERERERRKREERLTTLVAVQGNQVYVPVLIGYRGRNVRATLLLDTGASIIALHRSLAERLNVTDAVSGYARIAGGGKVKTDYIRLDFVRVGPHSKRDLYAGILDFQGPPGPYEGLLGMNFLRDFPHSIDYRNRVIRWHDDYPGR